MNPVQRLFCLVLLLCALRQTVARKGIGGTEQDWGYITVRPNAHMFWWLYYTTCNNISNYTERPLIIWIQGGPGMSSSGQGNFFEIGPRNGTLHKRKHAVTENFNVLFIDNPVGSGFSYVTNKTLLVRNGTQISIDLYTCLKKFMKHHAEFKNVPVYMFGESYGGKMVVEFAHYLFTQIDNSKIILNLKGIGLGDAYISPMDYVMQYSPLTKSLGLVDKRTIKQIDELAKQFKLLISKKEFENATSLENSIVNTLYVGTRRLDINNFLYATKPNHGGGAMHFTENWILLDKIMNGAVKKQLNLTSHWTYYSEDVSAALAGDFSKSVTHKVEFLLNSTSLKVIVYNGILDLLVNTAGTLEWMNNLRWKGQAEWQDKEYEVLVLNDLDEGYFIKVDNLVLYSVLRAGHSVPVDSFAVFNKILRLEILNDLQ